MRSRLAQVLPRLGLCQRVVIVGGPQHGKSTLAAELSAALGGAPVRATDTLRDRPWAEQGAAVAGWLREPGPQIIEGVTAVRGLRELTRAGERPSVVVVRLRSPLGDQSPEQRAMSRGVETVWRETVGALAAAGVAVIEV